MIDCHIVIKNALLANDALTELTSTRIWPGRVMPVPGYQPAQGGAVAFRTRGGGTIYPGSLQFPSVQFKCWGATDGAAMAVYRALYDALEWPAGGIKSTQVDALGQPAEEENGWPFVLGFWTVWLNVK
mgnify:CR=1 FL=1